MSDQRNKPPQKPVPQFRRNVRQEALKNVARLLSDYYQKSNKEVSGEELKKETFDIVKKMDEIASQNDPLNEQEYTASMKNQLNYYKQQLMKKLIDPKMMATVMKGSLKKLHEFMNRIDLIPRDLKLFNQLIEFIESIPSDKYGVTINRPEQIEAVKLYYEKLFIPVQKTMEEKMSQSQALQGQITANPIQQQQMMQMMQSMHPTMQPTMNQQQQMQRLQITPSMSQQMASPNQQELNSIPRQMPVPTIPNGMAGQIQLPQASQETPIPGLAVPIQPQTQSQQSQVQIQQQQSVQQLQQQIQMQQVQQIQQQQSSQQIQQQQSVQQLQQQIQMQQVQQIQQQQQQQQQQQNQNQRSPQQKPRSPNSMAANSPQLMQPKQQQQNVNSLQQNQQMPNSPNCTDIVKQLFQTVRMDCAVFYSTPHPPHF